MEPCLENKTLQALNGRFGGAIRECGLDKGALVAIAARERIHEIISFLRDDPELDFNMLIDLFGVDYSRSQPRFEVIYHLHSLKRNERLRIRVRIEESDCQLDTITDLYAAANWLERETWDMYGISFKGHPDLKRILMYEPFEGHPLRRDYPINRRQPLIGPNN